MEILTGGRVLVGHAAAHAAGGERFGEILPDSWVAVADGRVAAVGQGEPPATVTAAEGTEVVDLDGALVLPGFVDQHCHGGDRGDFFSADIEQIRRAAHLHLLHGTTSVVASLVTATTADLLEQIKVLVPLVDEGVIAGIHLEGPWLNAEMCGAHDPALLRAPDPVEVAQLLDAGRGTIRMVTLAPELPGALAAIGQLVARDVVAAVGHTACDYDTALAAIDAGATVATHLMNRMPHLGKRNPGPVLALLDDPRVTIELIADGTHVHPALLANLARQAGPARTAVVTDAMGAAGAPDGEYVIGHLSVVVAEGVARLRDTGALAGSTLTMANALRMLVGQCGFDVATASAMLSATPAAAMGLTDRGVIEVGRRADLLVLDEDLAPKSVMRAGAWVIPAA